MKIITTINPNNVGDMKSSKINENKIHFWDIGWYLYTNIEFILIT